MLIVCSLSLLATFLAGMATRLPCTSFVRRVLVHRTRQRFCAVAYTRHAIDPEKTVNDMSCSAQADSNYRMLLKVWVSLRPVMYAARRVVRSLMSCRAWASARCAVAIFANLISIS